jgi:hypothetical protein
MNPRVVQVTPAAHYHLKLTFSNGEVRSFNMKPYLETGNFRELTDPAMFNSVRPFLGSVQWQNGLDLCPDTLYLESVNL